MRDEQRKTRLSTSLRVAPCMRKTLKEKRSAEPSNTPYWILPLAYAPLCHLFSLGPPLTTHACRIDLLLRSTCTRMYASCSLSVPARLFLLFSRDLPLVSPRTGAVSSTILVPSTTHPIIMASLFNSLRISYSRLAYTPFAARALTTTSSRLATSRPSQALENNTSRVFDNFPPPPPPAQGNPNGWWQDASRRRADGRNNTAYTGRTLSVTRGNDYNRIYRNMQALIRQTGMRAQFKAGQVYEKPSEKRVRLASQRHRRRFKAMVSFPLARRRHELILTCRSAKRSSLSISTCRVDSQLHSCSWRLCHILVIGLFARCFCPFPGLV